MWYRELERRDIALMVIIQKIAKDNKIKFRKMKNTSSIVEGVWIENKSINLTTNQLAVLTQESEVISPEKQAVIDLIAASQNLPVSEEATALVMTKYAEKKPKLKETDIYEFISADFSINGKNISGLINCRINEEQKQVRF